MNQEQIEKGTYGVLLTPFDRKGHLEEQALRMELRHCAGTQTTGLLLCGSTGEFVYMDTEQQKKVLRIGIEECGKHKVLIGGASAATECKVLDLLFYMKELGYTYAIICPPYYYPQSPENIVSFYKTVSENAPAGMRLLMYNIPFCSPEVPLSHMESLIRLPNIIGMKDSSGNLMYLSKVMGIVNELRPDFAVFTGQDSAFLPGLTIGVSGCMSALCWMLDEVLAGIWQAYKKNDMYKASRLQMEVIQLVRHLDSIAFPENYRILSGIIGVDVGKSQRSLHNLNVGFCSPWIAQAVEMVQRIKLFV